MKSGVKQPAEGRSVSKTVCTRGSLKLESHAHAGGNGGNKSNYFGILT